VIRLSTGAKMIDDETTLLMRFALRGLDPWPPKGGTQAIGGLRAQRLSVTSPAMASATAIVLNNAVVSRLEIATPRS
jgi:hypothetical protein